LLQQLQESQDETVQSTVRSRLAREASLGKVETVYDWMQNGIARLLSPCSRKDVEWSTVQIKDTKISASFNIDCGVRFAEGKEYEVGGASSQMILRAHATGYPIDMGRYLLLQREVDLARKEWIKDCESLRGRLGGHDQLSGGLVHVVLAPALLPFKLQESFIRSFAVCEEPPVSALGTDWSGPGLMILEENPPEDVKEYAGWELFTPHKRAIQLRGTSKLFYVTPNADGTGIEVKANVRFGIPVSSWILPLNLFKKVVAEMLRESLRRIKEEVLDKWEEYDFDKRELACPEFFMESRAVLVPESLTSV